MDKTRKFLNIIRAIESSGGLDTNHPKLRSGLHAGDSATGQYALMPNTVDYLLNAEKRDTGEIPPYEHLKNLSSEQLKEAFAKDKAIPPAIRKTEEGAEEYLASQYADQLLDKYQDPELAQAAWIQGHNTDPANLKELSKTNEIMSSRAGKARKLIEAQKKEELLGRIPQSIKRQTKTPNILDLLKLRE